VRPFSRVTSAPSSARAFMSVNPITHFFSQIYYGWRMVGLVSAIRVVGGGLHQYGFTVFFLPISEDLGLSRAATSLAFSLSRAQGAIEAPLVGYLVWSKTYYCNRRSSGRGWLHSPFMGEQLRELSYHLSRRYLPRLHRRFRPLTDGHSQQLVHPPTRTGDDRRQRRSAGRWRSHFSFVGRWCRVLRMALGLARVRLHFSAGLPSVEFSGAPLSRKHGPFAGWRAATGDP